MKSQDKQLDPCPLCGRENIGLIHRNGDIAVMCNWCGCTSGFMDTTEEAVQRWNKRTTPIPKAVRQSKYRQSGVRLMMRCSRCKQIIYGDEEYVQARGEAYCEYCAWKEAEERMELSDVAELIGGRVLTHCEPEKEPEDKAIPGQASMFESTVQKVGGKHEEV